MVRQNIPLKVLINRLGELDEEEKAMVSDFIEFLCQRKEEKNKKLLKYAKERTLPSVPLEQVRADLATITGSLSEVITQMRQGRG
jgi:hypothetical protein